MNVRLAALILATALLVAATKPTPATQRWWSHIQALANDGMEGRDTGSEAYRRAARYVATQFDRLGLMPTGQQGFFQSVPMHSVRLSVPQSKIELERKGAARSLEWLRQVTVTANAALPQKVEAPLVFVGSASYANELDIKDKIVVELNAPLLEGAQRVVSTPPAGSAGLLGIDSPLGPEPARWPVAYAVAVSLAPPAASPNPEAAPVPVLRFNPQFADLLFEGSGHTYKELLDLSVQGMTLPNFPLTATLRTTMHFDTAEIASDNIAGVLPGSDPVLAGEYLALSAHLDGYGIGEPVKGDRIYNGAFDDAAYVATLLDFAESVRDSHTKLRRSLLFLIVTGEEKGLLGSRYFTEHPTIAKERIVANVNLDQLRPLFPLKSLTTLALDESTLGDTVRQVAESMGIRIQADPEPARNLLRRSDHWNFMQIGVPAVGFIFGYEKGSPEEAIYRDWYANRYHKPADDLNQPWDPAAAAKFNQFFARLVEAIANADDRPRWTR